MGWCENAGMIALLGALKEVKRFKDEPIIKVNKHSLYYEQHRKQQKEERQTRVVLLEGNKIVAKKYDIKTSKEEDDLFKQEIKNLQQCSGCSFLPEVLAIDKQKGIIYRRYAGESPKEYTPELAKRVKEKMDKLRNKYKLVSGFAWRLDGLPPLKHIAINSNNHLSILNISHLTPTL
jgi:hypothetical protein